MGLRLRGDAGLIRERLGGANRASSGSFRGISADQKKRGRLRDVVGLPRHASGGRRLAPARAL